MEGNKMNSELQKKLEELNIPTDYLSLLDWFEERGILICLNKRVIRNNHCWKATVEITPVWKNNNDINWWSVYNLNISNYCNGNKRQDAIDKIVKELLDIIPIKCLENYGTHRYVVKYNDTWDNDFHTIGIFDTKEEAKAFVADKEHWKQEFKNEFGVDYNSLRESDFTDSMEDWLNEFVNKDDNLEEIRYFIIEI